MSDEIELKLEIAPDATERLIADRPWLKASECVSEHQLTVYYDTRDFRLRKSGFTLRVRSTGDRYVQTLKALSSAAGLFQRGEWEWDVDGPQPNLERLADTPAARLEIKGLGPVIQSEVDRTTYRVDQAGTELEFDLDRGTVRAADREMPISELEVELIKGQPRAAVELAQRIAADVPIKLSVMSKAERGFALADGKLTEPTRSEPVLLDDRMTVAEGFATIVSACLRHFRLNEPLVLKSRTVEAFHQARVAVRRLRSAFALFRPVISDQESERIEEELSWFNAQLGDARNLDVYLERDLSPDQRLLVEEKREKAYDVAIAAIESRRFRRLMLELVGWSTAGQWRGRPRAGKSLAPFVNRRIDRLWAKIADSDKVEAMDDRPRHKLRIKMKKLRYALEFTAALHRQRLRRKKKFTKILKDLQENLGDLHDLVVARSLVTLDSWLETPGPSRKHERGMVRDADRAIRRLRAIRPYWVTDGGCRPSACAPHTVAATRSVPVAW